MAEANTSFYNEVWKDVFFEGDYTNKLGLQVSNYGRVRSIDLATKNAIRILQGSRQEGYAIIRRKLFTPQPEAVKKRLDKLKKETEDIAKEIKNNKKNAALTKTLKELTRKYKSASNADVKKRTINQGLLVHRLVAEFFCKKPSDEHTLVIHKDFNKLNNHYTNLQWATMEESIAHQQFSPSVMADKENRKNFSGRINGNQKLTVTRVMLIKKRLLEGRTMRQLARQFKVTETQIARIKKGENWAQVPAAS